MFYGIDMRFLFVERWNEVVYFNSGYVYGFENYLRIFGIVLFLGFCFNIMNRISLIVEVNFGVNFIKNYCGRSFYINYLFGYLNLLD